MIMSNKLNTPRRESFKTALSDIGTALVTPIMVFISATIDCFLYIIHYHKGGY